MLVALSSLDIKWEDKRSNLVECQKDISLAKKKSCDLIIFPEMTLTGFSPRNPEIIENFEESTTIEFFKEAALENNISIIFGVALCVKGKFYNTAITVSESGELISFYNKIHLFAFASEDSIYSSGEKVETFYLNRFKIGISICFDLRFPELFSMMNDVDLIINIANWPNKRISHWYSLLKSRSIENQSFVIGVNRSGIDPYNNHYVMSSSCFDPNGTRKKLRVESGRPHIETIFLDKKLAQKQRLKYSFKSSRRISSNINEN